jgi:hypothetical protein
MSVMRAPESSTWMTARSATTPLRLADVEPAEARQRIQKLLVTGDNRLKQGVAPHKVRETYEEALRVAQQAGMEETVRPLVEVRLADLDRLSGE